MPWLGKAGSQGFFGYDINPLALIMLLASTVIGVAISVYSMGYLSPGNRDHPTTSGHAQVLFLADAFRGVDGGHRDLAYPSAASDLLGDDHALLLGADIVLRQRGKPESRA